MTDVCEPRSELSRPPAPWPEAPVSPRATLLTDRAALDALAPAWRELLARSDGGTPFLSPEWLLTWWDVFGAEQGRRLRVLRFDDPATGRLVGLAPLLVRTHRYFGCLPFRRLEPLASGERDADSICTDYLDVIARREDRPAVAGAFVAALTRGPLREWDELVIPNMDGTGAMPGLLASGARNAGLMASVETTAQAPFVALPASWEAFLKGLEKKERYLVNRTLRDLEAWSGGAHHVARAVDAAGLAEGARVLKALHEARWEGTGGGTFRSPLFVSFHDRAMPKLLAAGALDLCWLVVRGEPVAAMYSILQGGRTFFYQCGRKRDVPATVRPGGALLYLVLRRAIEQGGRELDFLGGEAQYKRQLTRQARPLVRLRVARRGPAEAARRMAERAKDALRPGWRWLRGTLLRREPLPPGKPKSEKSA